MTKSGAITAFLPAVMLAACGQDAASAAGAPTKSGAAEASSGLPLKRGYYVASDTPCARASNATVLLLRRNGVGGARDFCEFRKIERLAPNTYRVTEACGDLQDQAPPEVGVTTYTLSGDTAFTSKNAHGWAHSARYCAPSSLPSPWRENDIRDVTG